jgi:hypothetical protein
MTVEMLEPRKRSVVQIRPDAGVEDSQTMYPNVNDVQRAFGISWGQLVELEPQLESLLGRAWPAGTNCRTRSDVDRVFGPLRNELAALIGFAGKHHSHPLLGSVGAYEVAYWKLYNAVVGSMPGRAGGAAEAPEPQRGETAAETCPRESVATAPARG